MTSPVETRFDNWLHDYLTGDLSPRVMEAVYEGRAGFHPIVDAAEIRRMLADAFTAGAESEQA